jgi:hypothetical protein
MSSGYHFDRVPQRRKLSLDSSRETPSSLRLLSADPAKIVLSDLNRVDSILATRHRLDQIIHPRVRIILSCSFPTRHTKITLTRAVNFSSHDSIGDMIARSPYRVFPLSLNCSTEDGPRDSTSVPVLDSKIHIYHA